MLQADAIVNAAKKMGQVEEGKRPAVKELRDTLGTRSRADEEAQRVPAFRKMEGRPGMKRRVSKTL